MIDLSFALIREGTSDDGLVAHIRSLLILAGASSALGAARTYKGTTQERLAAVMAEVDVVDMIFVHRDADDRNHVPRVEEITVAATSTACLERVVPVVPVQELEAWLLTDAMAIRNVVGNPKGTSNLGLPAIRNIETTSSPKEILESACIAASDTSGKRRRKVVTQFPRYRGTLLDRLDSAGGVMQLASWARFVADTRNAAAAVIAAKGSAAATGA